MTKQSFGDIQLHMEWRAPFEVEGDGQDHGNSGIFLQNRYEIQILDCFTNKTYVNGQTASVYKQHPPLVNACLPTGEWQTYDIIFDAVGKSSFFWIFPQDSACRYCLSGDHDPSLFC